ncbi:response regulator transcription factor [Gloeocapsa sp. PCC 73106]|uniref:response regulator transcription factor n=1 Tax=Gloeocapsa sp. PCC 73106 TaxID=102232 RepID=UPI0002ABAA3B|nr:response regulator transcription factor [Gloeocapsa sp. PCC 73106]ELR97077.1 response regulator containing a CheY-like receiver domain and an HTH DNA-binding domain [Gloeocapsa sp. PCC 73106]
MKDNLQKESKKLLLIDDDPNLILLVKDYLEFRGYNVISAENGKQALNILQQEIPDMIICDVMMPEVDGYSLVQQIRENSQTSSIPIMLLSAKGQSQDRVKGLNIGADVYMVKPFEPEELVAQVESTLKQINRLKGQVNQEGKAPPTIQIPHQVDLTPTEQRVIYLLAQGMANQEIAQSLNVSKRTIESHVSNMLNKTSLHNRTELARWAMENNLA